jgi:hypothetical protein
VKDDFVKYAVGGEQNLASLSLIPKGGHMVSCSTRFCYICPDGLREFDQVVQTNPTGVAKAIAEIFKKHRILTTQVCAKL